MPLEIIVNKDGLIEIVSRDAAGKDAPWFRDAAGVDVTAKPDSVKDLEALVNKFPKLYMALNVFAEHENAVAAGAIPPKPRQINNLGDIPAYLKANPQLEDQFKGIFDDYAGADGLTGFLAEVDALKKKHGADVVFQQLAPEVPGAYVKEVRKRNADLQAARRPDLFADLEQDARYNNAIRDLQIKQGVENKKVLQPDGTFKEVPYYPDDYDVSPIANFTMDETNMGVHITARNGLGTVESDNPFVHGANAVIDVVKQQADSHKGFSKKLVDGYKGQLRHKIAKRLEELVPGFPHLSTEAQQVILFAIVEELSAKGVIVKDPNGVNSNINKDRLKRLVVEGNLLENLLDPRKAGANAQNIHNNPIVARAAARQEVVADILKGLVKDGHHFRDEGVETKRFRFSKVLNKAANKANMVDWMDGPTSYKLQQKIGEILDGVAVAKGKTVEELLYGTRSPGSPLPPMTPEGRALIKDVKQAISDEVGKKSGSHNVGGKILGVLKIAANIVLMPFAAIANVVTFGKFNLWNRLWQNINSGVDNLRETKRLDPKYLEGKSQQNIVNKLVYGDATKEAQKVMGDLRGRTHHREKGETKDKREQNNRYAAVVQTVAEMITSDPKQQELLLKSPTFLRAVAAEAKHYGIKSGKGSRITANEGAGLVQDILSNIAQPNAVGSAAAGIINTHIVNEHAKASTAHAAENARIAAANAALAPGALPQPLLPALAPAVPFTILKPPAANDVANKYMQVARDLGVNHTPGRKGEGYDSDLNANRIKEIDIGGIVTGFKDASVAWVPPVVAPAPVAPVPGALPPLVGGPVGGPPPGGGYVPPPPGGPLGGPGGYAPPPPHPGGPVGGPPPGGAYGLLAPALAPAPVVAPPPPVVVAPVHPGAPVAPVALPPGVGLPPAKHGGIGF